MNQIGKIAIWVFGIILLSVVILRAGRYSFVQDNGSENFGPSGTSAFYELLSQSGYKLKLDRSLAPQIGSTMIIPVSSHNRDSFKKFLDKVKSKSKIVAFIIPVSSDKPSVAHPAINSVSKKTIGKIEPVNIDKEEWDEPLLPDAETTDLLEQQDTGTVIAQVSTKGDLTLIQLRDASCLTNKNIDQSNNAGIIMGLVKMVAGSSGPVTYVDSFAAQEVENSLLSKMGAPFQAAWSQILVLVLVIFITLSVRFGLAPERRADQRGARELVDGLAWMTRRKRNARWALRAVFDRSLAELERRHRVGREQIIQRPDLFMGPDEAMKLKEIEAATLDDITERDALEYAKELKRLV